MASTIKVTNIDTPDNTGNITVDRPLSGSGASLTNLPAANLTGTIAAIDGNALVGVTPRNFIIDGDFTQWPEGTGPTTIQTMYTSAMMNVVSSHDGTATWERSTDVPTVAQSGHQSAYSHLTKCTGTDTSLGASQFLFYRHYITGSDFAHLHQQTVTVSFWAKTSAANSGDTYYLFLWNGAVNRAYVQNFTPTSSWTKFEYTIDLDTSGTYLFTEADIGLQVGFTLAAGSTFDDAIIGQWTATGDFWDDATPVSNFLDNTSNEFYLSQFGLYLGSSAPTFTSPPIATVKDQVEYYIEQQNFDTASSERGGPIAYGNSTTTARMWLTYRKKRKVPTITLSNTNTWSTLNGPSTFNSATPSYADIGNYGCRVDTFTRSSGTHTANDIFFMNRDGTDTTFIRIDARH